MDISLEGKKRGYIDNNIIYQINLTSLSLSLYWNQLWKVRQVEDKTLLYLETEIQTKVIEP